MNAPDRLVTANATSLRDCFVIVPETVLPGGLRVPAFCVGQYLSSKRPNGQVAITAGGAPWVNINYHDARAAAQAAGYQLITESQALALAYQIAANDDNWTGGSVGLGKLCQGLRNWTVRSAQPGSYTPDDGDEGRWCNLPNGESICDAAGNAFTWVFDDVQGNEQGLIAKAFAAYSPSIVIPYPREDKGQGWTPPAGRDWSGYALFRGGYWRSGSSAGAFRLLIDWPDYRFDLVGFRCTKPIGL